MVVAPQTDQTAIDVRPNTNITNGAKFEPDSVFNSITKPDGTKITNYQDAIAAGMKVTGNESHRE